MQDMDLTLSHAFLTVDDQDKAVAFYSGVLGLDVLNDVDFEGMRWLTVGSPDQPGVEIVLLPPLGPQASERDVLLDLMRKGALGGVIFRTSDLDKTFESIRDGGGEVMQEPIDQPYGVRDCAFRDPFGNMLRFSEPRA
ncbi:VOC family protein [Acidothermaceae bacterium B102]|nr:VOC family protein [Acidothermaceae bacterium B102]